MTLRVVERFVAARGGDPGACEDGIVATAHFAAVIDGATAKRPPAPGARAPGRIAMETLSAALETLAPAATAGEAAAHLSAALAAVHCGEGAPDAFRPTASAAVLSAARREVWLFGDCQALVGRRAVQRGAPHEEVLARTRALVHRLARAEGMDEAAIARTDPGRAFVLPLLERLTRLNDRDPDSPFAMGALNGLPLAPERILVVPVPPRVRTVVLATDGYPALRSTLAATEAELARVLAADPLCEREHLRLKGLPPDGTSFDDRAYVRVVLARGAGREY